MSKFYDCFKGSTTWDNIKDGIELNCDVVNQIQIEMESDTENESYKLLTAYQRANEDERALMDYILVCLCGYTMNTIIEHAKDTENFEW